MKPDRKQISAALIEHLEREELHTGEAAKYLNLNPCYISMAKSEKSWDAMGKKAWDRLEEWFNTRENIRDFQLPEGEEIWKKPERDPAARITEPDVPKKKATGKEMDEHSPANLIPDAKKEKPGKSVKLVINQAEIDALRKEVDELKKTNEKLLNGLRESEHFYEQLKELYDKIAKKTFETHDLVQALNKYSVELECNTIPNLTERLNKLENSSNLPSENGTATPKGFVIFQRNYFKS